MIGRYLKLHRAGVMGLNERNVRLVNELNARKRIRLVNDKTVTKKLAAEAGLPTPHLRGVIANAFDMRRLREFVDHPGGVAIKPANGSQGNGILVIAEPMADGWRLASGRRLLFEDLKYHVNNILSGMHSLAGLPDTAMVEDRVKFAHVFDHIAFKGVPDIRIIVLKGVPIAAMVRLPTAESDGKANLHKGGVGVGLDIDTGITAAGMQHGRVIDAHPDTGAELGGLQVPFWDEMLMIAARAYDVTGLGYLGADIVLDEDKGPQLLELNARPGIAIQVATRSGLRPMVDEVLKTDTEGWPPERRIALGRHLAGSIGLSTQGEAQRPLSAAVAMTSDSGKS